MNRDYLIEGHIVRMNMGKVEFLLLKRASTEKYPKIWQMITGKIKENEKAFHTFLREVKEETNLDLNEVYVVPNVNSFYDFEKDEVILIPVFLALVDYNSKIIISSEHSKFKWVNKREALRRLAWQGQKESVKIICDYLSKKSHSLNFIKLDI